MWMRCVLQKRVLKISCVGGGLFYWERLCAQRLQLQQIASVDSRLMCIVYGYLLVATLRGVLWCSSALVFQRRQAVSRGIRSSSQLSEENGTRSIVCIKVKIRSQQSRLHEVQWKKKSSWLLFRVEERKTHLSRNCSIDTYSLD